MAPDPIRQSDSMSWQSALQIEREQKQWPGRVLVGFDGSPTSGLAVEWAIREVAVRGSSLRIGNSSMSTCFHRDGVGVLHDQRLSRLLRELHDAHPSMVVDLTMTQGDPRQALIEEAQSCDLLVLPAPDAGAAEAVLLGSLARTAVRRSPCPVAVVRGSTTGPLRRIVVGVDGSSAAEAAIDWACDEANLHGAELVVIHSRHGEISRAEAGCVLDLALDQCRERTEVGVSGHLAEGSPTSALIDASRTADLVAIGSRGRSGFKTAVFGSVALSVAGAAWCPVAITHPRLRRD